MYRIKTNKMRKASWIFLLAIAVSCGTKKEKEEIIIVEEAIEESHHGHDHDEFDYDTYDEAESETPKKRPVYRETETILTDLIHTKLEVNFDWEKSRMNGVAWITAKPHFYASDSLILDAKGMDINSVSIGNKALSYTYENDFLKIDLGKTYTRDDKYTVMIDYVAKPEERTTSGSAAITSDKGLYFINPTGESKGKMPQIWTQGETEASSVWFPTIDSPNAKTTQEIFMTVNDKYATLSNGKLVSSKKLSNGDRIDHWKQELPHAPYLFMMAVGEFKVVKDSYKKPDGSAMDVFYYVEPEWEPYAKDIFGETPTMIKHFSELLGVDYPWDKYHQVVVRDYVSGAMENTGAVIFGDFVYKNDRELLDANDQSTIAHELFHHWFGDLVTCESWSNLPLNESFANYSQYLWDEYRYGLDEADLHAEEEADGYFQSAQMQGSHNLIWFDYDDKEQMFDGHSYNKGGRILHMLRNHLGDDAFFAGVKNYLEKNKFKPAEFHQLRLAFEEVSGQDLNWFFNQWFLGAGHPVMNFKHEVDTANNTVTVSVEQVQDLELSPIYRIPLVMAIYDENGKHEFMVTVDELEEKFSFPFTGSVKGIIYDDQFMLLGAINEEKSLEQYVYQYYHGERFYARRDGLMKGSKLRTDDGQKLVLDALSDDFWHIRELAAGRVKKLKGDFEDQAIAKLKDIVKNDPKSDVRQAALKTLAKELDDEELKPILVDRIENDRSYSVVSSALSAYVKLDPDKAVALAQGLEKERSSKMMFGISQIYAGFGDSTKYDFFTNALNGNIVQGFDKLGLMSSFTYYLTRMESEYMGKAIEVYADLAQNGGFYMKMFAPQNLNYLLKDLETKKETEQSLMSGHEENNDHILMHASKKKIAMIDDLITRYTELVQQLEE